MSTENKKRKQKKKIKSQSIEGLGANNISLVLKTGSD